jgi:fucose permease
MIGCVIPILFRRRAFAAGLACFGLLLIGWSGLLVPGLSPEVEAGFAQNDVGLGFFYFVTAAAYAVGSLAGGMLTERMGRRRILVAAALLHCVGLVAQGMAPGWEAFVTAGLLRSLGAGGIDGGMNGLIVDLFEEGRGRALSLAHICYAAGALGAPFALAFRSSIGLSWEGVVIATGLATIPLAALLLVTDLADGRRHQATASSDGHGASMLSIPLVVLAVVIGCYVAGSTGVSNWLVRFMSDTFGGTTTSALGFYWAGLVVGRLLNAAIADRFDHVKLAITAVSVVGIAVVAAVLIPSMQASIALFALVGCASGPIYPLMMTIGGDRFPGRAAAMTGILSAAGVVGSLAYPPLMGVISVTVGLQVAMLGIAALDGCALVALLVMNRFSRPEPGSVAGA